ncbi:putative beta-D-xylosidase 7 [Zea mays]|uniref:Putative beta-D-xylosidase 7 n=1 Tax=Zea mays TaxID=4577 RepID=A0A3L6FXJ8_MAIZE|nr:putative beta-D-xylosidase 7 [Zea mays]
MNTFSSHNARTALLLLALSFSLAVASDPMFSCGPSSASRAYPFCDRSLPAARRAADLVSRLTVAEKVSQLGDEAAGVPRLGVPPYKWWSEGLHGLAFWGHGMRFNGTVSAVTSFPQVLLTTASFDESLWFRIGQAIGREARALYNLGQAEGLTIWSLSVQQGKMTEKDVDKALTNLFAVRMRLGHFDGDPRGNALYGRLGAADVCTADHKNLALEAAQDGIVLLKNDAGILPLDRFAVGSAAVIGHNANDPLVLSGNYFGPACETTTPLEGLQSYVRNVRFLAGCSSAACGYAATGQAAALASSAEYVFLFMGLSQDQEKEGLDRTSLLLPGKQQSLVTAVASAAKRPVVLVLLTGGPVDITFAQSNPKIGAILWAGYPGQAGGLAIARVLFGDHNPSGRLPVTWYTEDFTKVPMTDMRMRADPATGYPGRTYRFYRGKTIYKFGYGLSYSKFSRQLVTGDKNLAPNTSLLAHLSAKTQHAATSYYHVDDIGTVGCEQLKFPAEVEVLNHGPMDGKHSVLMFLRWPNATDGRPVRQLIGFRSQHIKAGEKANVRFHVSPCEHFSRTRADGKKVIDRGSHFLMVGKEELEISFEA